MHNPAEAKRILEAVLLASQEPLGVAELKRLFDDEVSAETLRHLLAELREEWNGRAVELVSLASGWRFQTRAEFSQGQFGMVASSHRFFHRRNSISK